MNNPPRRNNDAARQLALPDPGDLGTMILHGAAGFARRNKVIAGSYVLGILVLLLVGSGTRLTYEQRRRYETLMNSIDVDADYRASQKFNQADYVYRNSRGWFFTCDETCQYHKRRRDAAQMEWDQIRAKGLARMNEAKAVAGLFSEVGVSEVKDRFWSHFHSGQQFAKRQTMWDAMFIGIRSMTRDENFMQYVLRVLMQILVNFSMGLVMALVFFIFGLWGIVRDYNSNPIVAVIFFVLASCAAFAFVASYLLAMFGATAGGLYGLAKIAEANQRAQLQNGGQQRYVHGRPHYD